MLFSSCEKEEITPGEITYPEYHDGRLNLLALQSDTLIVQTVSGLGFTLAADVPANRSLKVVVKPSYGTFWNGFGFFINQSNTHWHWSSSLSGWEFNTLEEELEMDKFCYYNGMYGPFGSTDPNEPNVPIHVIIYEDNTEWITRYITVLADQ